MSSHSSSIALRSDIVSLAVPPLTGPATVTPLTVVKQSRFNDCPSDPVVPTEIMARTAPLDIPLVPALFKVLSDISDLPSPLTDTPCGPPVLSPFLL